MRLLVGSKMDIKRIIISGRLYKNMECLLKDKINKEVFFLPEDEITEAQLNWADAFVGFRPSSNFDFYNLKWVHCLGAGVDSFLLNRKWKDDVILTRTTGPFGTKISEYCLSYILMKLQHHENFKINKEMNKWERIEPLAIKDQRIIIFGTGDIAQDIAKMLGSIGVVIDGVSLSGTKKQFFNKVMRLENISELLESYNWVINTLPLTEKTTNYFDGNIFKLMNNVGFINVGRGASVNESSLIDALNEGNVQSAVLDVFNSEPLCEGSELWNHPRVYITPHISAITTAKEAADCFIKTLKDIEADRFPLVNGVNYRKGY